MTRRITALLLCISMLMSFAMPIFSITAAAGESNGVTVLLDGVPTSQVRFPESEKRILTASAPEGCSFQWQILTDMDKDIWVNIYDKTEATCEVSRALIQNATDENGGAYIRCRAQQGELPLYSDPVYLLSEQVETAGGMAEVEMILLTELEVIPGEEETEPTEEAAEPSEEASEPTEETSEPTEETSEPTEEATEPTEEATEPTEEATEPTEEVTEPTEEASGPAEAITEPAEPLVPSLLSLLAVEASAQELPEETEEYVTITIRYLDYNLYESHGELAPVYSPYTARIEAGSSFRQTVISPTYLGFAPFWDGCIRDTQGNTVSGTSSGIDKDCTAIQFSLDTVSQNLEVLVFYKAIEVNYAVRYYFQNINNDLYTEDASLYTTAKAVTGTIIEDKVLEDYIRDKNPGALEGFEMMYHIPEAVAADGSTVFEVYLDRVYAMLMFDLDGGYGTDPIYARYGTPIVINTPTKYGYSFIGWDLLYIDSDNDGTPDSGNGSVDTVPASIPSKNQYYKALWTIEETTYTVVYWLKQTKNGNPVYSVIDTKTVGAESASYVSESDTLGNNVANRDKLVFDSADKNVQVEGDGSTVVNVYYRYKEYTLKFYYAMSSGSGENTKYYVIGGSTYYFGANATVGDNDKGNEIILLNDYMYWHKNERGEVDELPRLNSTGQSRGYSTGYDTGTAYDGVSYKYYYISFTAEYLSDISNLWPCNVFNSVTRLNKNNANGWSGTEAFVSAWNGEHHVYYSQHPPYGNQTIKGNYMLLDYALLWDTQYGDSDTVDYLCFWENGANIGWSVPELYRYNIYVPLLDGQDSTGLVTKEKGGVTYYLLSTFDTCDDSNVNSQTAPAMTGYTYKEWDSQAIKDFDRNLYREAWDVNFYYSRQEKTLAFYNHNGFVENKGGTLPFGTSLEEYYFEPAYPNTLEENAYTFAGWYTTAECYGDSRYGTYRYDEDGKLVGSFEGCTMPANNLTLYAKWVPKTHTVRFFNTYQDMLDHEGGQTVTAHDVRSNIPHGNVVGSVDNPDATNSDLSFAGWFYMENGQKKAFSPTDFPIRRDMNIFADWSSRSPQPYRIEYVLMDGYDAQGNPKPKLDDNGNPIHVADNSEGQAYYGSTRTFPAKAGSYYNQLYVTPEVDYNKGYFPTVDSHSITIDYEATNATPATAQKNIYTFYYVKAQSLEYTVRYLDKETGLPVADAETFQTEDAVVTARFKPVTDMVPDGFYKRLVLAVEIDKDGNVVSSANNVITFYYTKNTKTAYYAVHFMLEKPNATETQKNNFNVNDDNCGYVETGVTFEGVADVNTSVPIKPREFPGFALLENEARERHGEKGDLHIVSAKNGEYPLTVTAEGTDLYIFYKRLSYPYAVHYYKYNTTEPVDPVNYPSMVFTQEKDWKPYESILTETAPEIPGYTCVNAATQTITIRQEEPGSGGYTQEDIKQNVIIFYYSETQYTVEYVAVPQDTGILSGTLEVIGGTEDFTGSTAQPGPYYRFLGWYLDEACTQPVESGTKATLSDDGKTLVPIKDQMNANDKNIFYAQFAPAVGPLTIVRSNVTEDSNQVFVYQVTSRETGESIYVTVRGKDDVTIHNLLLGEYTVTQLNDWSWRYSDAPASVKHDDPNGTTVQFSKSFTKPQWLNGHSLPVKNEKKKEEDDDA